MQTFEYANQKKIPLQDVYKRQQEPLVNLCKALVKNGQKTARELLNCEGTACFHNTDIWGKTSPATGKAVWAFWPFGEAWLCRNLFDQYLFTEDKEYLKDIMPILEENVRFCLAQLQETDQGLAILSLIHISWNIYL